MKLFEIPYNFDRQLLPTLDLLHIDYHYINSIYMIPYPQDYIASWRNEDYQKLMNSMSREEYESQIQIIKSYFYGKMMLLLQQPDILLTKQQLDYYLSLGFTKFCVGSLAQAKQLKEKNSNLYVLASILNKIMPNNIIEHFDEYKKYLDGIVLHFYYNKNLSIIKQLPKDFEYVLLVNCWCSTYCEGTPHWLYGDSSACRIAPYKKASIPIPWAETGMVRPCDLELFEPYIKSFKLQGRDYPTWKLVQDIILYFNSQIYNVTTNNNLQNCFMDYDILQRKDNIK